MFITNFLINIFLSLIIWKIFTQNKIFRFYNLIINFITNDLNKINFSTLSINMLISLFFYNCFLNLTNLIPFSFCLNSQLNSFFFFCLVIWFSCIIYSLKFYIKNFFSHLTPLGCPIILSPLIVIIEVISFIIRPITLRVRISANILAGHLLIHLLTNFSLYLILLRNLSIIFIISLIIILNLLEIRVSIIQPYILCVLINIYLCERN